MWDLPRSGIKSILPALADGLFTTDPPGKTSNSLGGGFHDLPMLFLPSFKPGTFCMLGEHDGGFPGGSDGKESACDAGDPGLIPGSGRSPGEGNGYPLQYPCLKNSVDKGRLQSIGSQRVKHD